MLQFDTLPNVSSKLQKGQEAIDVYEIAFHNSISNENKASSKKNQGFAAFKLMNSITTSDLEPLKIYWIYAAAGYYKDAYYWGSTIMEPSWTEGIIKNIQLLWQTLKGCLIHSDSDEKVGYLQEFEQSLHPDFISVMYNVCFDLSKSYYNLARNEVSLKDFKLASQLLSFSA